MDQVHNTNSQYHHPNLRAGYGTSGHGGMMSPSRQGNSLTGPANKAAMAAPSSPGGFQRLPGPGQQQHPSGATPTLNQLLTSPSPMMRGYGGGYPDYPAEDTGSQYDSAAHGWGGQQRSHPASISPGSNGPSSARPQVKNPELI